MANILLINPSYQASYGGSKVSIINPIFPTLGLATIAAPALRAGHTGEIMDMSWRLYDCNEIRERIVNYKPDIVGVTATTPLMNQLRDISVLVKDISKDITMVGGGAHPTAMPEETLRESFLDAVFLGEADYTFTDICNGQSFAETPGLFYRDGENLHSTGLRAPIENLDDLPIPAWELYDPKQYNRISRLIARRPPVTMAEFSRGCVFRCDFCASKITMALGYRKKSPQRCAEEVRYMYELGFREFLLADDIFTSDQKWARSVCEAVIDSGVEMAWSCTNGIRVESADDELFQTMRRAGCYRVSFGFESGSDRVLKAFGKGGRATVQQGRAAVKMANRAGIDSNGYFLLGLSPDNEESMTETIDYARQIPVDMMKFGMAIAFPGTTMFNNYLEKQLIRSFDWDLYFIYTDEPLYTHDYLDYKTIQRFLKKANWICVMFNPSFILRRLIRGFRTGEFFWDIYYALNYFLLPSVGKKLQSNYYARDRWPTWDFYSNPPAPARYQTVGIAKEAKANV